jgi:O-antigen/teichoic acid export membrane protein
MEIKAKGYLNSVFILMVGTIFAQLIPVALQPFLRREYTPEDFGEFAMFSAVTEVLVTIASLRYEQAILVPKTNNEAKSIFKLSLFICAIFNALLLIVFLCFVLFDNGFIRSNNLSSVSLLLIPFASFFFSIVNSGSYWYTRVGDFKGLSINKLFRRIAEGVTQIGFGIFSNPFGLIIGMFAGVFIGAVHIFHKTKIPKNLILDFNYKLNKDLFVKHKSFVLYGVLPSLLNILSIFIPVFIISSKFSSNLTGQFDLSRQILALPLVVISGSLSQVLIKKVMTKFHNGENFMKDLRFTFLIISVIAIFIVVGYYLIGEFIVVLIFGEKWKVAAELSKILILGYGVKFINTCFYNILIPLNKVKILGWWQGLNFLVSLLLILPIFSENIVKFSISYTVVEVFSNIICLFLVFSTARNILKEQMVEKLNNND